MRRSLARRLAIAGALLTTALLLGGLAFVLRRLGWERADQLSSVLAMFFGLLALGAAGFALRQGQNPAAAKIRTSHRHPTAWGRRPLRDDVRRLLEATQAAADRSPNRLLGARQTEVSTVYVQQRVEQPRPHEGRMPDRRRMTRFTDDRLFLPFDQRPRVIPVRRPLERVFDQHRHLLIEGGPGTGKSTTAGQVCRQLAASWLTAAQDGRRLTAQPLLPLLVTARALAAHVDEPWPQALAAAAFQGLGLSSQNLVDPELLANPVDSVEWLIVVDGLDEVPADERETFLGRLSSWTSATDRPYRLLITTRPLAGHATSMLGAGSIGHYTLLPFDRRALGTFARRWFADEDDGPELAAGFLGQITAAGLSEVASVPLMATIAITVYESDPVAGLPRNRHDLYERYLHWLRLRSADRRTAAWAELASRLPQADGLLGRVDELLEELAVQRVESRRSLVLTAIEWLRREAGPVTGQLPEDWGRLVAEALISTGLLSRRDAGPDFIHLTFAEHFAARRYAGEIPETFDPDDAGWRKWLHGAVHADPVATAVLARWAREHPATEVVDWLLSGAQIYRTTALHLAAEGTPVTPAQVAACLGSVEHILWGQPPRRSPFSLIRRLPSSTVVTEWIERRFASEPPGTPLWSELAALLADRDRRRRQELATSLQAAVADDGMAPADRLAAAKALIETAPEHEERAVELLCAALRPAAGPWSRRMQVATFLAEYDGPPRAAAVRIMQAVLRDAAADLSSRTSAAEALAEWDGESREVILGELRRALHVHNDAGRQITVAKATVAIAPDLRGEAAACARDILGRPSLDFDVLLDAAQILLDLGADDRTFAVRRLLDLTNGYGAATWAKLQAADLLARLGEEFWPDALDLLRATLRQHIASSFGDPLSLDLFRGLDQALVNRVVETVVEVAADRRFDDVAARRVRASAAVLDARFQEDADAAVLDLIGPSMAVGDLSSATFGARQRTPRCTDRVASVAAAVLTDPAADLPDPTKIGLAKSLFDILPGHSKGARDMLRKIMSDDAAHWFSRFHAAVELANHPDEAAHIASFLTSLHHAPSIDMRFVTAALHRLAAFPGLRRQIGSLWNDFLAEPHLPLHSRILAVKPLLEDNPERRSELTAALLHLIDQATNTPKDTLGLSRELLELGHRDAERFLMAVADDVHTATETRADALSCLSQRKPSTTAAHTAALSEAASDRFAFLTSRWSALRDLLNVGETPGDAVDHLLADLPWALLRVDHPNAEDPYDLVRTAEFLLIVGDSGSDRSADEMSDLLLRLLDTYAADEAGSLLWKIGVCERRVHDALAKAEPCVQLLSVASTLMRNNTATVVAAIERITESPARPPRDRARALEIQLALPAHHRTSAVRKLRDILSAPAVANGTLAPPAIDRLTAAGLLYGVVAERATAGETLGSIVADPSETWHRRRQARNILSARGGPRGRHVAVTSLMAEVLDETLSARARSRAAVDLAATAPGFSAKAVEILQGLLGQPNPAGESDILRALLDIDVADDDALGGSLTLMSGPGVPHRLAVEIAAGLADGSPVHRRHAGRTLEHMLADPDVPARRRITLLGLLARALPGTVPAVVAELRAITGDTTQKPPTRAEAAAALCRLESPVATRAGQTALRALVSDRTGAVHSRLLAGRLLLDFPGPHRREARQCLLELEALPDDRLAAAVVVVRNDGPPPGVALRTARRPAAPVLRELLRSPGLSAAAVHDGATELISTSDPQDRAAAAAALRSLANDDTAHTYIRTHALAAMPHADFSTAEECSLNLWEILLGDGKNLDHRRWAAEALAELADSFRRPARDALRALDTDDLEPRARRRLQRSIAFVDRGDRWLPPTG